MKLLQLLLLIFPLMLSSQSKVEINGKILSEEGHAVPFANISVIGEQTGASADRDGLFQFSLSAGAHTLKIQAIGYKTKTLQIDSRNQEERSLQISLAEDQLGLDQVVISATRNRVNLKKAPVVVNVLSPKLFNATQSISVAESLNFQPGVRVETNCQNCGFTQVRLNGLDGSYTQVLINSRAVFQPLIVFMDSNKSLLQF